MDAKQNEVMVTYYIYEIPGKKNGATKDWEGRGKWNFKHYGIEPILIETIEGPDEPDMWKIVGDREWELADANGYNRGEHYLSIRQKASKYSFTREDRSKGGRNGSIENKAKAGRVGGVKGGATQGRRNAESGHMSIAGKAAAASPNSVNKQKVKCPYCDKVTTPPGLSTHLKFNHKKRTAN